MIIGRKIMEKVIIEPTWHMYQVYDLLKGVFEAMRKNGYIARGNAACCSECSLEILIPLAFECRAKGAVYWTQEDEEGFKEEGRMFVHYFTVADTDESFKEMTGILTQHLKDSGLFFEWSGSYDKSIEIIGFEARGEVKELVA
jgi:hypothetical protein